tara:strand:- start:483 stop:698 length:216 start_codon:yes stop_codon:yes gene_type:complete
MREYKILVVEEDEMRDGVLKRGDRPFWLANHVVVRKNDGTCETVKDRYSYPSNLRKVEIYLPEEVKELTNE